MPSGYLLLADGDRQASALPSHAPPCSGVTRHVNGAGPDVLPGPALTKRRYQRMRKPSVPFTECESPKSSSPVDACTSPNSE